MGKEQKSIKIEQKREAQDNAYNNTFGGDVFKNATTPESEIGTKREIRCHNFGINRTADFKSDINIDEK
ncbi:MAG: hypothetical protein IKP81_08835 [Paludibacteraceae bacterium]|nr:hypothetical protein [Paludibacteraceae bacterium]